MVGGVDAEELDAGEVAEAVGGDAVVELGFAGEGALVAVAEGIGYGLVSGVEADVVDGPAVDGDGADGAAVGLDFDERGCGVRGPEGHGAVLVTYVEDGVVGILGEGSGRA